MEAVNPRRSQIDRQRPTGRGCKHLQTVLKAFDLAQILLGESQFLGLENPDLPLVMSRDQDERVRGAPGCQ